MTTLKHFLWHSFPAIPTIHVEDFPNSSSDSGGRGRSNFLVVAVCVYSNAHPWSDCDPESMLRSKTVGLKQASDGDAAVHSHLECPRAREGKEAGFEGLTPDILMKGVIFLKTNHENNTQELSGGAHIF